MNEERLYRMIEEKEGLVSLAFPALMRKVYVWMTLALVDNGLYSLRHSGESRTCLYYRYQPSSVLGTCHW